MAAAGLPIPTADHPIRAALMALDMMDAVERFNAYSPDNLSMRIGVDTGAVVAGIFGKPNGQSGASLKPNPFLTVHAVVRLTLARRLSMMRYQE